MTLDTLVILAGSLVALLPFLGFPNSVDKVLFLVLGIFVISLGIAVRRRTRSATRPPHSHFDDPLSE